MTTAAVYNEYWSTGGGGETFCGGLAEALVADGYTVTLLSPEPFDLAALGERLSLDLSGCALRVIDGGPMAASEASADFDVFVNGSFLSTASNRADVGIYVVHFPGQRPEPGRWRTLAGVVGRHRRPDFRFSWGDGIYARDGARARAVWSGPSAEILASVPGSEPVPVRLAFDHQRPDVVGDASVRVSLDGVFVDQVTVRAAGTGLRGRVVDRVATTVALTLPAASESTVSIEVDAFVPADHGLGSDLRSLGVPIRGLWPDRATTRLGAAIAPDLHRALSLQPDPTPVGTYDLVASNSEFTRRYVEDWWSIEKSPVLYPPVVLRPQHADKAKRIVSLGRFFAVESGHSKKQIELVQAFRDLVGRGVTDWSLTLIGGCDPAAQGYLDEVRAAAAGLPVEIVVNASGDERDRALGEAAIFWHATGLGEDPDAHPDRMEHFGISTVEAMSTGAVPVVFAGGGQIEIVEHGVSGYHFHDLDSLVERTAELIADDERRRTLAAGARRRSEAFGPLAFRQRLRDLMAQVRTGT